MDYMEVIVGVIGLAIAIWTLNLQRKEIIKNGKLTALIHSSSIIQEKIDFHSKIIADLKVQGKPYSGHASRINEELRPLKRDIDNEFLNITADYGGLFQEDRIREALKFKKTSD